MAEPAKPWDGDAVRIWLERRIAAARADQVAAERAGYGQQDDCDKAAAEELVCAFLKGKDSTAAQSALTVELKALLDRDQYVWRGVYDDARFERHVRAYIRKLLKMTRDNAGFDQTRRYQ
jgi:hypothetical protein